MVCSMCIIVPIYAYSVAECGVRPGHSRLFTSFYQIFELWQSPLHISLISYKRLESNYPVAALSIPPIQPTDVISFHNFRPIWRMKDSKTSRTLVLVFSWFSKVSLKICHLRSDSAQRCVTAIFASSVLVESFVLCDWHQMHLCRRSFRAGHAQRSGERRHISTVVNCNCQS